MKPKSKQLQKAFFWLSLSFILLLVLGTANVYSATFVAAPGVVSPTGYLLKQMVLIVLGLLVGYVAYKRDYKKMSNRIWPMIIITFLLLAAVLGVGVVVKGARRWIGLGGFTFQPSELAKIVGIIFSATVLARALETAQPLYFIRRNIKKEGNRFWRHSPVLVHPVIVLALGMALFVFKQPDAGTALVIFAIPVAMLWISGASFGNLRWLIGIGFAGLGVAIASEGYRMQRLVSWINPWKYQSSLGYQATQSFIAIGSGGILGQGVGNGISKFSYLPEAHTDLAFAVLAQEWGFLGVLLVMALFCLIIVFGFRVAFQCRDRFGMLMALGITMYFGGQGLINIGMNCGIFPVIGVPLPFISYGGTSLILNMFMAALLLNICRRGYREAIQQEQAAQQVLPPSLRQETQSRFIPGK